MLDILHKNAIECLVSVFERDKPEYETRNSSVIRKPIKRSTRSVLLICQVLPSIWGSLPYDIIQETNRPTFFGLLGDHFLVFMIYGFFFFLFISR